MSDDNAWLPTVSGVLHLNGVPWFDAPLPRRWHKCWPQTIGEINMRVIQRCPCGALRYGSDDLWPWIEKNQTRKARSRERDVRAELLALSDDELMDEVRRAFREDES